MSVDSDVGHSQSSQRKFSMSPAAIKHVKAHLAKNPQAIGLRVSVTKTGCSGLAYQLDFVEQAEAADICIDIDGELSLFVDKTSYPFLKGSAIDYVKQGLNYKFMFQNPNQTGACGCGESFTID